MPDRPGRTRISYRLGSRRCSFSTPPIGVAPGARNFIAAADAGAIWSQVPVHMPANGYLSLEGSSLSDSQDMWGTVNGSMPGVPDSACYQYFDGPGCSFPIRSTDGGAHWSVLKLPTG